MTAFRHRSGARGTIAGTVLPARSADPAGAEPGAFRNKLLNAFNTHSGKAVLLKTPWNFPGWSEFYAAAQPRLEKQELWITNGRINEVWQSGFDDLRNPIPRRAACRKSCS
ncbi:MAG: hypothetical protein IPH41_05060 [Sulfuritalea sp.]|nr:hypothetical protein [Sulfuritalea sp.]